MAVSHKPGEVEDLASLPHLNEDVLLRELKARYDHDNIYSYVGDIVVAVNPFKQLSIYGTDHQEKYRNVLQKTDAPPHIYAVADRAYHEMLRDKRHQCCVISGESGAGKTESAKYMIQHIIYLCHSGTAGETLEHRILQVNPLLEAFGNAATNMNDNSSRFGKYTELIFTAEGQVCGAKISDYLLEKSRVVQQQYGEQNFHIFHYLFASPHREKYALTNISDFPYLRDERLFSDRAAAEHYDIVVGALADVGFDDNEMEMLHHVLAAVLHFSRITFTSADEHDPASLSAGADGVCCRVADLLGVDAEQLQSALLTTTTITRGEAIVKPYTAMQAQDSRNATAKELYRRMFAWIVSSINAILDPEGQAAKAQSEHRRGMAPPQSDKRLIIGILDIFGFENFDANSFEQFCINLANEQLQHFFNNHIFKLEMEEYRREGVDATDIAYVDNQPVLDMFLNRPIGLLALLDEESHFPRATDDSLVEKWNKHFGATSAFSIPQGDRCEFHIKHYAGTVRYDGDGFLDKNRDSLPPDIVHLFSESSVSVVAESFQASISSTGQIIPCRARWSSNVGKRKSKKTPTLSNTTNKRALTVSAQFRNSLLLLVDNMAQRAPHFVRCIKPNTMKESSNFQDDFVLAQLNYTGMLETTRIRKEGYSVRPRFEDFMERYKIIAYSPDTTIEPGAFSCQRVLDTAGISDFKLGRTKVFLKYYDAEALDVKVTQFKQLAVNLQRVARGFLVRRQIVKMREERDRTIEGRASLMAAIEATQAHISQALERAAAADKVRHKREAEKRRAEEEERREALAQAEALQKQQQQQREEEEERERQRREREQAEEEDRRRKEAEEERQRQEAKQQQRVKPLSISPTVPESSTDQPSPSPHSTAQRHKAPNGVFYDWFHGILSRRDAEILLTPKPIGCFLIRVSATQFGYSLTYRVDTRCRHYLIGQENTEFFLVGSEYRASSLEDLIRHYQRNDINEDGDRLTIPCGQTDREEASHHIAALPLKEKKTRRARKKDRRDSSSTT